MRKIDTDEVLDSLGLGYHYFTSRSSMINSVSSTNSRLVRGRTKGLKKLDTKLDMQIEDQKDEGDGHHVSEHKTVKTSRQGLHKTLVTTRFRPKVEIGMCFLDNS